MGDKGLKAVPPQWGLNSLHTRSSLWCVQGLVAQSVASIGESSSTEAETQGGCRSYGSEEKSRDGQLDWNPRTRRGTSSTVCQTQGWRVIQEARLDKESRLSHLVSTRAMEADSADWPSRSRDKKKTVSSSVSVVGRSRSDGSPVPSATKVSEHHRSCSGDRNRWSHGSERRHNSPRSRHSPRRRSGERARPTSSSGGSSSRARHADLADAPGSGHASGKAMEVQPSSSSTRHQRHHSRSSGDHRSLSSERSGSSYVSRREVQLFLVVPQAPVRRTITVIPSPPRPARMDKSTSVTGPTDLAALADSAGVTGLMD